MRQTFLTSAFARFVTAALSVSFASNASRAIECSGDCNDNALVTVDELVTQVNIALDAAPIESCFRGDSSGDGFITVDELIAAVRSALDGCPAAASPTPTSTLAPSPTPTANFEIPLEANELLAWLRAGNYLDWTAESGPHASAGPHFGTVRSFLNHTVFASLAAGRAAHPAGSAIVKELYGSGDQVQGWSVMVKVQEDSAGGAGWYWLEHYGGSTFAASKGASICTGCHSIGNDFVRTRFPLQ